MRHALQCFAAFITVYALLAQFSLLRYTQMSLHRAADAAASLTRPLWDTDRTSGLRHAIIANRVRIRGARAEQQPLRFRDERDCADFGFRALRESPRSHTPRVFDVFMLANELEMLEVRLNELEHVVDTFVIIESNTTFTGRPKPMFYWDARHNAAFRRFARRILHVRAPPHVLAASTGTGTDAEASAFGAEARSRMAAADTLRRHAWPGDVVLLSDVDEIPRAAANLL